MEQFFTTLRVDMSSLFLLFAHHLLTLDSIYSTLAANEYGVNQHFEELIECLVASGREDNSSGEKKNRASPRQPSELRKAL